MSYLLPPPLPAVGDWEKLLDKKDGEILSTLNNARVLLRYHPDLRGQVLWNSYSKRIDVRSTGVLKEFAGKKAEAIVIGIQDYMAHVLGVTIKFSDMRLRVMYEAECNTFNPLELHLKSLKWDRVSRIDDLFPRYFGAGKPEGDEPTQEELVRLAHLRRISRRWLLGAVERAFRPGCKVDNILILEGLQGARKTSALEALGGEFYCSTQITLGDKDSKMIAASNWFVDMPDTHFMKKGNRGFITTREDTFRPPFGASVEKTKRCCVLIGSMNDFQYFDEEERRYWPVRCDRVDLVALMRDRDQIWAEAVFVSMESEKCPECHASDDTVANQRPRCARHRWWLDAEEEKVAAAEAAERVQDIPWKKLIHEWWLDIPIEKRPQSFTTEDVAMKALCMDESAFARGDVVATKIGIAVRSLGFRKKREMLSGIRHWVYVPSPELAKAPHTEAPKRGPLAVLQGGVLSNKKK